MDCLHLEDMNLPRQKLLKTVATRLLLPGLIKRRAEREDLASYDVIMASNGMAWSLYRELKQQAKRPLLVTHFHGLTIYDRIASITEAELEHQRVSLMFRYVWGSAPHKWDMAGIAQSDLCVVQNVRDLAYVESKLAKGAAVTLIQPAVEQSLISLSEVISPINSRPADKLITMSSWGARKGSFYLPGVFRRIRQSFPKLELVIGGTGMTVEELRPFFAPEDRDAIRASGFLTREEQARLYNEAAIFLFPSISEGFGLALLEAQLFGLAAVTTNTGYGGDFLTDGVDARIVPLTTEHLARGALSLLENNALRCAIAERGRELARRFTLDVMAEAYERAFLNGLQKRNSPAPV